MTQMRDLIAEYLKLPPTQLSDTAGLGETPGWDSFTQLSIMIELEQRFGIPITDETIRAYSNLAAIARLEQEMGLTA
jgi:acyl carrier protein